MKFVIPGRLPSLNETTRWERSKRWRFFGARKRKLSKSYVGSWILAAGVQSFSVPVDISILWIEKDRRRDYDNIASGVKVILDALVAKKVIPNDSRKWVYPVRHEYAIDKLNPRIEVTVEEHPIPAAPENATLVDRLRLSGAV